VSSTTTIPSTTAESHGIRPDYEKRDLPRHCQRQKTCKGSFARATPDEASQNARYIEQQLQACPGLRANDVNMPMRTIAGALTPAEMKSLASAYATGLDHEVTERIATLE
jgi:hypothetical protein